MLNFVKKKAQNFFAYLIITSSYFYRNQNNPKVTDCCDISLGTRGVHHKEFCEC